ncbi:MAG: hypothetical protein HUU38_16290 [Anaerolineales bacterium]|nr:hypothetical protein [Anaerolineales bacterium]
MSKKIKKSILISLVIVCAMLLYLIVLSASAFGAFVIGRLYKPVRPSEVTTPLAPDVVIDLCQTFSLPETDHRCRNNEDVYAVDFFEDTKRLLNAGALSTYEKWENTFGDYLIKCSEPQKDSLGEYFVCDYDFHGDGVYSMAVFFYENGQTMKVFFSVPGAS